MLYNKELTTKLQPLCNQFGELSLAVDHNYDEVKKAMNNNKHLPFKVVNFLLTSYIKLVDEANKKRKAKKNFRTLYHGRVENLHRISGGSFLKDILAFQLHTYSHPICILIDNSNPDFNTSKNFLKASSQESSFYVTILEDGWNEVRNQRKLLFVTKVSTSRRSGNTNLISVDII